MFVPPGIQEGKKDMAQKAEKPEKIVVEGAPRSTRGKNEARRLRQTGKVPAVLYGGKGQSITLAVNAKQVSAILRSESGHNTLFQVDLGGKHEPAILKDWLTDPITGKLLHVDLLRVAMDVRMKVMVPVHTFGEPAGVKVQGGVFEVVTREDRKSTRLNSSHLGISYAVFCLKKKNAPLHAAGKRSPVGVGLASEVELLHH